MEYTQLEFMSQIFIRCHFVQYFLPTPLVKKFDAGNIPKHVFADLKQIYIPDFFLLLSVYHLWSLLPKYSHFVFICLFHPFVNSMIRQIQRHNYFQNKKKKRVQTENKRKISKQFILMLRHIVNLLETFDFS